MIKKEKKAAVPECPDVRHFHMEADALRSGISVLVSGVERIADFSPENLVLSVGHGTIEVYGSGLKMSVFENGRVEVFGAIGGVRFDGKRL